jgi:transcriptional regulator with XRE-family HTH domain
VDTVVPGGELPVPGRGEATVGAVVLRMLLGTRLRRFRDAAGLTPERAGYEIRASPSKISRMETGKVRFKLRDIEDLLNLYGVADVQERAEVLALARQSGAPDWWRKYSDILPGWFETFIALESAASTIRNFELQFVPGLFQTRDYARAATRLGHQAAPVDEIEDRVALRLKRQQVLSRPEPPTVWSVIDEAVLRRPLGGPEVMRAQLRHLIEAAEMPHVRFQVVPFGAGGHAGAGGSFSVLRFAARELPDVVYIEQLTSAMYLEERQDVEHYLEVMDHLSGEALTPAASIRFIERAARET